MVVIHERTGQWGVYPARFGKFGVRLPQAEALNQDDPSHSGQCTVNDPRLYEWTALRSIAGGGMAKCAGVYFNHGRPVPDHLTGVFDRLMWSRLLVVADGGPLWELRRISWSGGREGSTQVKDNAL